MTDHLELRHGVYQDSVTLLRIAQTVAATPGVTAAQVAMATELNVELTAGLGFSIPDGAGPNDLLVALRGDDAAIAAGLEALEGALAAATAPVTSTGFGGAPPPQSVRAAAQAAPDAAVVLLSVPGSAVLGEALDAIDAGRHVMIFSDNVPIEHEVALKDAAAAAGVIVMGPDCGTAIIGGVGLGFANVLGGSRNADHAGPTVGVIAASGTGAQQLTCLLDQAGVAVSQVIGVGGRDLSEQVGGRSTLAALELLTGDPATDHIVIISKPPRLAVAKRVQDAAAGAGTPATPVLLGQGRPNITEAVETTLGVLGVPVPDWPVWLPDTTTATDDAARGGALRGLFSGGTLADEAMLVAGAVLTTPIRSNIPLTPESALPESALAHGVPQLAGLGTVIVDLGDDEFTRGRPHPMIDPTVRLDLLAAQAADPDVRVVLLDVVLGHCAEPDPSALLAPAIVAAMGTARAAGRALDVVVSLCGTAGDPQDRERQAAALVAAGARVYSSNAAAAGAAAALADPVLADIRSGAAGSGKDL